MARLVFFGNERLASGIQTSAPLFSWLIDSGHEIVGLVLSQSPIHGRKKKLAVVEELARQHNIEVLKPDNLDEISGQIKSSDAEFGVLAAYGRVVPQATIDLFKFGILNLHPSLLPAYRGSSPIEAAILNGDETTGISLMGLVREMDAGPVYGASEVSIEPNMSKQSLYEGLSQRGVNLLDNLLPKILDGSASIVEQDHTKATYTERIDKEEGRLDWAKPAEQLEREVRAYLGWPGSYTAIKGIEMIVTKAAVSMMNGPLGEAFRADNKLGVYCGDGALIIEKLKPAGKKEMPSEAFLNGYKIF